MRRWIHVKQNVSYGNPSHASLLRIVATTDADGITAGVAITGPATNPEVAFTSTPQLPQEEVLAQILFGRRLENLSAIQALQLANAVAILAGRGGDGIVARLRQMN